MPKELRNRILFTLCLVFLCRLGTYIPVPGVDVAAIASILNKDSAKSVFGFANLFSGGAIERISIFSLSMMPYITASIIVQLLSTVSEYFKSLKEDGISGRRKTNQISRYLTIILALVQAVAVHFAVISKNSSMSSYGIPPIFSLILTCSSLVGGAVILMWFGERISISGVGNGISILVLVGIVSSLPSVALQTLEFLRSGYYNFFNIIQILAISAVMLLIVCFVEKSFHAIKIHYPSSAVKGGQDNNSYLPLKVNISGVIPPIFASSVIMFFLALLNMLEMNNSSLSSLLSRGGFAYIALFSTLVVFFSYFYSSIVFDPNEIANNLKKSGCYVSGVRPGNSTSAYISDIISKLSVLGAIYLVFVCAVPEILVTKSGLNIYIGGTGILIIVNVASDLSSQIRSHLLGQKYSDPFGRTRRRKRVIRRFS